MNASREMPNNASKLKGWPNKLSSSTSRLRAAFSRLPILLPARPPPIAHQQQRHTTRSDRRRNARHVAGEDGVQPGDGADGEQMKSEPWDQVGAWAHAVDSGLGEQGDDDGFKRDDGLQQRG